MRCFDWKIGVFQQIAVRGILVSLIFHSEQNLFLRWFEVSNWYEYISSLMWTYSARRISDMAQYFSDLQYLT